MGVKILNMMGSTQLQLLFTFMSQKRLGNSLGCIEPKAVKRRLKAFPMLMKSRSEAREEVKKNGRPKKLKQVPFESDPRKEISI